MNPVVVPGRIYIIGAALLALFLGAMDALVMSAAMPTIITELGGLHLYAWVYSAYFLSRAVSLPVFGKLSDLFNTRKLFLFSIGLFILSSMAAGAAPSMAWLIAARVFQGISAGGVFALVYVVLSDISQPAERPRILSFASSVWGISSIIGPTLGGIIVTYFSWRWIFYINVPLGILSFFGIGFFLKEFRNKSRSVHLDIAGITFLSAFILSLLTLFMSAGRTFAWRSVPGLSLVLATMVFAAAFYWSEKKAADPILNFSFFKYNGFTFGILAAFLSSFSIFSLFAYVPIFLQGSLEQTPMQVGLAMLSLSLGWSLGSLILGRIMSRTGEKAAALSGAFLMLSGCLSTLWFTTHTSMLQSFIVFQIIGLGMGFITLSTLLLVQASLSRKDLGVATSFHQFSRTLGGAIGVGICGGIVTSALLTHLETATGTLDPEILVQLRESVEILFKPEFMAMIPHGAKAILHEAVLKGVSSVFFIVCAASAAGLICCWFLPGKSDQKKHRLS